MLKHWFITIASFMLVAAGFFALLMVLGMMLDGVSQYQIEHDRCLKHATNGLEIRACR